MLALVEEERGERLLVGPDVLLRDHSSSWLWEGSRDTQSGRLSGLSESHTAGPAAGCLPPTPTPTTSELCHSGPGWL